MRSTLYMRAVKRALVLIVAALCCALIPSAAFAAQTSLSLIPEGAQGAARDPFGAEDARPETFSHCVSLESSSVFAGSAVTSSENAQTIEESVDQVAEDSLVADTSGESSQTTSIVAQAESSCTYLLAQTLESTRTAPIVSATLPLAEASEITEEPAQSESVVVGSFEVGGIVYAFEPGGDSVAVIAVNPSKLPTEDDGTQLFVLSTYVSPEGSGSYAVTRIADGAFSAFSSDLMTEGDENASRYTVVVIPTSVTSIEADAFTGFESLQYFAVLEGNLAYATYDGCLYDSSLTKLLLVAEGRTGTVTLAAEAKEIDAAALSRCAFLEELCAPSGSEFFASAGESNLEAGSGDHAHAISIVNVSANDEDESEVWDQDGYLASVAQGNDPEADSLVDVSERKIYNANHYTTATITLDKNGGSGGDSGPIYANLSSNKYYTTSACTTLLNGTGSNINVPSRTGWGLYGYVIETSYATGELALMFSGDGCAQGGLGHYPGDSTIKAYWYKYYYERFNANGGTGTVPDMQYSRYEYGGTNSITVPSCTLTRTGYVHDGWATSASGEKEYELLGPVAYRGIANDSTIYRNLYAHWTAKTSSLTFDLQGATTGVASRGLVATYDSEMPSYTRTVPQKTGYIFTGFYDSATGGTQYYTDTLASARNWDKDVTEGTTLYAQWTPKTSELTFKLNGATSGTVPTGKVATYDESMPTYGEAAPTRTGYTFTGFYDSTYGGTQYYTDTLASARTWNKNVTTGYNLYAHWTAKKSNLIFDLQGAESSYPPSNTLVATYDSAMPTYTAPAPTKTGYTFAGFYDQVSGGSQYYYADLTSSTSYVWDKDTSEDTTLYARWIPITYTVNYYNWTGTTLISSDTFTYGTEKALAAIPTAYVSNLYKGVGWSGTKSSKTKSFDFSQKVSNMRAVQGAVVDLYLAQTEIVYKLTLDDNGATTAGSPKVIYAQKLSNKYYTDETSTTQITCITPPKKTGYTFYGYTCISAADGTTIRAINDDGLCAAGVGHYSGDTTLVAEWRKNYEIKFNTNGATSGSAPASGTIAWGSTYKISQCSLARPGYTLDGWATTSDGEKAYDLQAELTWSASYTESGLTLYAHWLPNTYTVEYWDWRGEKNISSDTFTYGVSKELAGIPDESYLHPRQYNAVGWSTSAWSATKRYDFGQAVSALTTASGGTVKLYVTYQERVFKLTLDGNGATTQASPQVIYAGAAQNKYFSDSALKNQITSITPPKRDGYTFYGFMCVSAADGRLTRCIVETGATSAGVGHYDGDTTLVAEWRKDYEVRFNVNGGKGDVPVGGTVAWGSPYTIPECDLTKPGYTFDGWAIAPDGGRAYSMTATVSWDLSQTEDPYILYAHYSPNEITIHWNAHNGTDLDDSVMTYDPSVGIGALPDEPERAGSTFKEWNTAADGSGTTITEASSIPTQETTIHAIWDDEEYGISFDTRKPDGETNDVTPAVVPPKEVTYYTDMAELADPSLKMACHGYEFKGWSASVAGQERMFFDAEGNSFGIDLGFDGHGNAYGLASDVVLTPIWEAKQRTVRWDFAYPMEVGEDEVTFVSSDEVYNQAFRGGKGDNVPTCSGYDFAGWYTQKGGQGVEIDANGLFRPENLEASTITYFAYWTAKPFRVTLLSGEHGSYERMQDVNIVRDAEIGETVYRFYFDPAEGKHDFTFPDQNAGWDHIGWEQLERLAADEENPQGGWKVVRDNVPEWWVRLSTFETYGGDLYFRAKWADVKATITLEAGSCTEDGQEVAAPLDGYPKTMTYGYAAPCVLPDDLEWTGHTFQGWCLRNSDGSYGAPEKGVVVEAQENTNLMNLSYRASWVKDVYSIGFAMHEMTPDTEIASVIEGLGRDDSFEVPTPAFRNAIEAPEDADAEVAKDLSAYVFTGYSVKNGTASLNPGDPCTVAQLLEANPDLRDKKGEKPHDGSVIVLYGRWVSNYHVDVPLVATVLFDPDHPSDSLIKGEAKLYAAHANRTGALEVVSLVCDPMSGLSAEEPGTEGAFDNDDSILDSAFLTLSAKKATEDTSASQEKPLEVSLGQVARNAGNGVVVSSRVEDGKSVSLPEIGFAFGGATQEDRTLELSFGLRFTSGVDLTRLAFLNGSAFKDSGMSVPVARVYYTLAMAS